MNEADKLATFCRLKKVERFGGESTAARTWNCRILSLLLAQIHSEKMTTTRNTTLIMLH